MGWFAMNKRFAMKIGVGKEQLICFHPESENLRWVQTDKNATFFVFSSDTGK